MRVKGSVGQAEPLLLSDNNLNEKNMKMKRFILASLVFACAFSGCTGPATPTTPTTPKPTTPKPEEPEIEYIEMYYDDRISIREITGGLVTDIEIKDETVTSRVLGSDEADPHVIIYEEESGRIIASGTGTAVLVADGKEYNVRVSAAPITLVFITGHSMGYGSKGNADESVLCPAGQVYNSSMYIKESTWPNSIKGSSLGYTEADRVVNIDSLTKDANGNRKGVIGVNSALAYEWNRLTGEKIWVVNTAVGGSSSNQWQGDQPLGRDTVKAMNIATSILKNEVAAGHYEYRTSVVLNFSGANFSYNKVEYDDEKLTAWQDGMWKAFVEGAANDIDGDGEIDAPEMLGYIPDFIARSFAYGSDKPLTIYRSASSEYPHVFLAADMHRGWRSDNDVYSTFPRINYTTHTGVKLERPTTLAGVVADNSGHYFQVAYNAQGFEIAKAIYENIKKDDKLKDVEVFYLDKDLKPVELDGDVKMTVGETRQFVAVPKPFYINDLEITVTGNLKLESIFYVTATAKGEGEIVIKRGDEVVKTVEITVD